MTDLTDFLAAWTDAERTGDATLLGDLLTADFVGVGPDGYTLTKPAWLARHQGGDVRYEGFAVDELDVRAHGAVAVVTVRQTTEGTFAGRSPSSWATSSSSSTTAARHASPAST